MTRSRSPRPSLSVLLQVLELARWAAERDQGMVLPEGRSEVLRLFSERFRDLLSGAKP